MRDIFIFEVQLISMAESDLSSIRIQSNLRPLDVRRDLPVVADLIEECFASTMDPDGQEYLRQMRRAANDETFLRWAPRVVDQASLPISGFVWEEEGKVVANLSLIPLRKDGQRVYLIANVAVTPSFRRRGIARALTQAALGHVRARGSTAAWLQVRADNEPAYHLYQTLGFIERARRTTWMSPVSNITCEKDPAIDITFRRAVDWRLQSNWLGRVYPPEVSWNLPLSLRSLSPAIFNELVHFFAVDRIQHWVARKDHTPIGFLTWESSHSYTDNLWLAPQPDNEDAAIRALLPLARSNYPSSRLVSLNYPAGRAIDPIKSCGFTPHQTLAWMEVKFK
ncbi:MAG: GNAT family N-acetyltransferase [Chloroflexi bacterium]|nr:GNAT family N-acetyltransferase [Chloroflexota bacterium]